MSDDGERLVNDAVAIANGQVPAATLLAIAKNAVGLFHDAQHLFDHGSYPRAAALAVLAGEEAGKFWLVKWDSGWRGKLYNHQHKIAVGAALHPLEAAGITPTSTGGLHCKHQNASENSDFEQWLQRARDFLPIKEAGLYVDLQGSAELRSDPCKVIGPDDAVRCLTYAEAEVKRLYVAQLVKESLPPLRNFPTD